jgi:hypothetical protein
MKKILLISGILSFAILTVSTVQIIKLDQNCTGYLKRAADANTVETALAQLRIATTYLEENNMTTGHTSVLWRTPDEDVEFWYKNLKDSEMELMKVNDSTPSFEQTNLLMKLRETLLDQGDSGTVLTTPPGLSRYPNNLIWGILLWFAVIDIVVSIIWGIIKFTT